MDRDGSECGKRPTYTFARIPLQDTESRDFEFKCAREFLRPVKKMSLVETDDPAILHLMRWKLGLLVRLLI
jgi:hypothetical protein